MRAGGGKQPSRSEMVAGLVDFLRSALAPA
jgi:hypothetical protein